MTTSSQENDWAVWMRAAMTGDAGAYRRLLVSLTPYVRAVARSRCRRLGAPARLLENCEQIAAADHITGHSSSARTKNVSGIMRPIALAVLRLTTSSNLVGCITG